MNLLPSLLLLTVNIIDYSIGCFTDFLYPWFNYEVERCYEKKDEPRIKPLYNDMYNTNYILKEASMPSEIDAANSLYIESMLSVICKPFTYALWLVKYSFPSLLILNVSTYIETVAVISSLCYIVHTILVIRHIYNVNLYNNIEYVKQLKDCMNSRIRKHFILKNALIYLEYVPTGQMAGFATVNQITDDSGWMTYLFVGRNFRNKGVGFRLMVEMYRYCVKFKFKEISGITSSLQFGQINMQSRISHSANNMQNMEFITTHLKKKWYQLVYPIKYTFKIKDMNLIDEMKS